MNAWENFCTGYVKLNDSYINGLRKQAKSLMDLNPPSVFPQECSIYAQNIAFQLNDFSQKMVSHSQNLMTSVEKFKQICNSTLN